MLNRIRATIYSPDRFQRIFHFIIGSFFFRLPKKLKYIFFAGKNYYCPICGNQLKQFLNLYRPYHKWCPVCQSLQRHKLLWILYNSSSFANKSFRRILHFAPEPALSEKLMNIPGTEYLSADLNDPKAMIKMDICHIQFPENTFDFIQCSHVLEHVRDDRKAISELWRVLSPNGWAIILVPIRGETTIEDSAIHDPIELEKTYGQLDHLRIYGRDFSKRLQTAGFTVKVISTGDLADKNEIDRFGLDPDDIIFWCEK